MINEKETLKRFGYQSTNLSKGSRKRVVRECDSCHTLDEIRFDTRHFTNCLLCSRRTDEYKERMSKSVSAAKTGVLMSDTVKLAYSKARRGVPKSEAHKAAISVALLREKTPLLNGWELEEGSGMSTNPRCGAYLGCYIAEQLLAKTFKNVQVMPHNNHGFDFICGKGYKVDVKSATTNKLGGWAFHIRKNRIANYFLCIAFDDRNNLNPQHIWLIPGDVVNHLTGTQIRKSTLMKWKKYEQPIGKAIACCNELRTEATP